MEQVQEKEVMTEPYGFEMTEEGLFWEHPKQGLMPVTATLLRVIGIGTDVSTDGAMRLVHVSDVDGKNKEVSLTASELAGGAGNAIRRLAEAGMVIIPGMEKKLITYIQLCRPELRFDHTSTRGWLGEKNAFVTETEVVGDTEGRRVIFQPKAPQLIRGFGARGTIAEWKSNVAVLARNNLLLILCLCAALAGPLLKLLGFSGGGVHFYGRSSRGKTTLLQVGSSIWGDATDPAVPTDTTLIRTWHSTGNAMDALAEAHSDTLLPLDELGKYVGKDLDHTIYSLCGGQEKAAMNSQRQLRKGGTWHSNIMTNGEFSIIQRIEMGGKRAMTGHSVRIIDIPISDPFQDTHGMESGQFANRLKVAVRENFGTAGPAFVRKLVAEVAEDPELSTALREHIEVVTDELKVPDMQPEQVRVLRRFALYQLAGQLACGWGILPFDEDGEEVTAAVVHARDLWLSGCNEVSDIARAIQRLRSFILRYHGGFVNIRNRNSFHANAKGFWNPEKCLYLFDDDQLRDACGGADPSEVAKELRDRDLLVVHEPGRLKVKQKLSWMGGRWERFYSIHAAIIGEEDEEPIAATISPDQTPEF